MSITVPENGLRPKTTDMPIVVEPSFPTFTPRPLKENLKKQTANLILVNTSPYRLIFKIVPNTINIKYSIRPEIDYLAPNGCRFVDISINETPRSKREHDFTYKVLVLNSTESFGLSPVQFWDQNQLDHNDHQLQEAQFVCLESETESPLSSSHRSISHRRIDNEPKVSLVDEHHKQIQRHTALFDHSRTSNDPQPISSTYHRKQSMLKNISPEIIQYPCNCTNSNHYFWQEAATLRSFFYGFALACICSALLIFRKKQING
ncbi:unnamed protein product [Cercopithifilaria johnstoni]|uniref:Major sperm protein n=1 Tax=Cercopithifilaria johnstoni TaxID=2874296 RepID=A0A8J2LW11_9BILA|nr:unnamed protein product [Cercopithifilaria johnstoni]